ncbi:UNVERIFIED_CONTAM: putative mitochondrial protein [Sesamum indicum]
MASEPVVFANSTPVLYRSTRVSQPPDRYGFLGMIGQLDNDPRTYGEVIFDIDSDRWLEAVYKRKLGANRKVTAFKARLMEKGYTQQPGVDFEETYSPVAMAKSIRALLFVAACYDYEI